MVEVTFIFKKDNNPDLFYGKIIFTSKTLFERENSVNDIIKPYVLHSLNWINKGVGLPTMRKLSLSIIGLSHIYKSDAREESTNDIFDLHIICYDDDSLVINGYGTTLSET